MLAAPANWLLTALFLITGLWCLWHYAHTRRALTPTRRASEGASHREVVDLNHAIMSAAMILMVWVALTDALLWAQVGIFAILTISLLLGVRAATMTERLDTAGHGLLNVAMIWMLLAMPALMASPTSADEGGGHHAGHHHGGGSSAMTSTPGWVEVSNHIVVVLCLAVAAWWLVRLVRGGADRWHRVCHLLMALGMAAMLVAMS